MANLKHLACVLRSTPTDAETKLWAHIRRRQLCGLKFRRQYAIDKYIVDFICLDKALIIEVDGGQHSENPKDTERTRVLESNGFVVLRFWNNDVLSNIDGVLLEIERFLNIVIPHPNLPPQGEGT